MTSVNKYQQAAQTLYHLGQVYEKECKSGNLNTLFLKTVDQTPFTWVKRLLHLDAKPYTLTFEKKSIFHRIKAYLFEKNYVIKEGSQTAKALQQLHDVLNEREFDVYEATLDSSDKKVMQAGKNVLESLLESIERAQTDKKPDSGNEIHALFDRFSLKSKSFHVPQDENKPIAQALWESGIKSPTETQRPPHKFEKPAHSRSEYSPQDLSPAPSPHMPSVTEAILNADNQAELVEIEDMKAVQDAAKERAEFVKEALRTIKTRQEEYLDEKAQGKTEFTTTPEFCEELITDADDSFDELQELVTRVHESKSERDRNEIQELYVETAALNEAVYMEGYQLKTDLLLEKLPGYTTFEEVFKAYTTYTADTGKLKEACINRCFQDADFDHFPRGIREFNEEHKADFVETFIEALEYVKDLENPTVLHLELLHEFLEKCRLASEMKGTFSDNEALFTEQYDRLDAAIEDPQPKAIRACTQMIIRSLQGLAWSDTITDTNFTVLPYESYVRELQDSLTHFLT